MKRDTFKTIFNTWEKIHEMQSNQVIAYETGKSLRSSLSYVKLGESLPRQRAGQPGCNN